MRICVTGGAGYIGGALIPRLHEEGHELLVVDRIPLAVVMKKFVHSTHVGSLGGSSARSAISEFLPDACIHLAASMEIEESKRDPLSYYMNNVVETIRLFDTLDNVSCRIVIFASTAAIYQAPPDSQQLLAESAMIQPANPYGWSKWCVEQILSDLSQRSLFRVGILRFFNAAGATVFHGEAHEPETHLIPRAVKAVYSGDTLEIYGRDHVTPDGTAVRDYVHIADIAEACIRLLGALQEKPFLAVNIGAGRGISVREVVDEVERATGLELKTRDVPERSGEPSQLVADIALAKRMLCWSPKQSSIESIVSSAVAWHMMSPFQSRASREN